MKNTQALTKKGDGLTPKQERFAQEFVVDLHQVKAAVRAGYSAKSAPKLTYRLMANEGIRLRIAQLQENTARELGLSHRYVLQTAKDGVAMAYQDKNAMGLFKGAELIGKHLGTFEPKVRDLEQRPAFVGISINMGDKPSVQVIHADAGATIGATQDVKDS